MLSIAGIVLVSTPAHATVGKKNVLVLHSYHKGYLWTDNITEGISRVLSEVSFPVNVQYEYMDSKRIFDKIYVQQIVDLYRYKFRNKQFDAILSSDDNAFNFLRDYRDQLFPGTPVIYCGTNYMTIERAAELPNSTGVNETANFKKNIELILQLHPQATHIAMVMDTTTTGNRVRQQVDKIMPAFNDQVTFVLLQDLTMKELANKINDLPASAVVLYTPFLRDRDGVFFEYDESIDMVTASSAVPVYITWDFSMGNGAVGGLLTSGAAQGETAARLALQVLMGKPANSIPYVKESPNKYIFDYNALQRFGIDFRRLPASAFIRNQPEGLHTKYRELIWKSIGAGTILIFIIGLLTINILRRRRAEILLSKANEKLEERVRLRTQDLSLSNNQLNKEISEKNLTEEALHRSKRLLNMTGHIAKVGGWELDVDKRQLTWTEEVYRIHEVDFSFNPDVDKSFSFYHPESKPHIEATVQSAIDNGEPFDLELRFITAKGNHLWVRSKGEAIQKHGKTLKVFGTFQNITEHKRAEEERNQLILKLQQTLDEVKTLQGFLPICSYCKNIRDDKGYWNQIESYLQVHSEVEFSHSICQECAKKHYPELDIYDDNGEITEG